MQIVNKLVMTFLLNSMWQIVLIALTAWLCSRLLRNAPSCYLYRLWVICLVLSLLLPLLSLMHPSEMVPAVMASQFTVTAAPGLSPSHSWLAIYMRLIHTRISFGPLWTGCLAGLYLLFITGRLGRFLRSWRSTRRLLHSAYLRELPSSIALVVQQCRSAYGLEEIPVLCSALVHGPITLGVRHPVVIIPEFLFINGSEEQWLSIAAHEFAHIRRRDFLFNLLQELVYWPISFHPAATVMKRQISATRERLCDEMATARLIDRPSYARALVNIAGMLPAFHVVSQPDYSLGIFDGDFLEERIMKLLRNNPLSESWTKTSLLLSAFFLLAVCLSVSAFSFNVDSSTNTASVVPSAAGTSPGQDLHKVGPGIVPPKVISKVNPIYPEAAKKAKQEGNVQLALIIGADGRVENVRVEKPVSPDLDKSAIDAVRQWTWEPALKDGKPVKVDLHIDITFTLYK